CMDTSAGALEGFCRKFYWPPRWPPGLPKSYPSRICPFFTTLFRTAVGVPAFEGDTVTVTTLPGFSSISDFLLPQPAFTRPAGFGPTSSPQLTTLPSLSFTSTNNCG